MASAPEPESWLRALPDGALVHVQVAPGAARSGVVGLHGDALRVRVRARPIEGAANRELLRLLAEVLGIRVSSLSIDAGEHARRKQVRIRGLTAGLVRARLAPALSVDTPKAHD